MKIRTIASVLTVLAAYALSMPASAQFGGPPGGFRGGPPRGGFMGGMSAANVPADVLTSELGLSAAQSSQIQTIDNAVRAQRMSMFRGGPGAMGQDAFAKMRAADDAAAKQISAILTPAQRKKLPGVLSEIGDARVVNIPLSVYSSLHLTGAEKSQIAGLAASDRQTIQTAFAQANGNFDKVRSAMVVLRSKNEAKLGKILTAKQNSVISSYRRQHPFGEFRGPGGGPGGPGMGGPPPSTH
jgi:hypothetical protein